MPAIQILQNALFYTVLAGFPSTFSNLDWSDEGYVGVDSNGVFTNCVALADTLGQCNSSWADALVRVYQNILLYF